MSGGIDSAYSACLLKKQGYKTVGFTFDLLPRGLRSESNPKVCCSAISMHRARRIADRLSIPHYVINMQEEFEHYVIRKFVDEYGKGRTPNPCVLCNRHIKFASFLEKALAMGADRVATGHYARLEETPRGLAPEEGEGQGKGPIVLPLSRPATPTSPAWPSPSDRTRRRRCAASLPRTPAGRRRCGKARISASSPAMITGRFIGQFIPLRRGPVVTVDGARVGYHDGVHLYTVGQRRGINIPYKEALYVIELRAEENLLVVGPKERLMRKTPDRGRGQHAHPRRCRERRGRRCATGSRRSRAPTRCGTAAWRWSSAEPISAITPGQSVVLYDGETVLGGGTIRLTGHGSQAVTRHHRSNPGVIAG